MNGRILYVDRLKGFAILLVVMGHMYLFSMHPNDVFIGKMIQSFHMPLFLFLSGFVISTPPDFNKIKNKCRKYILPMFVFGTSFSLYIQQCFTLETLGSAFKFVLGESKNGYWYFLSLTMFYLTLPLLGMWKKRLKFMELTAPLVLYVTFYIGWRKGGSLGEVLSLEHAACFYPFYVLGYLSRKYDLVAMLLKRNMIFTMALAVYVVLFNLEDGLMPHDIYSMLTRFIAPTMAIIMVLFVFVKRENTSSPIERQLSLLGKETMSIYVLHFFIVYKINLSVLCPLFADNSNTFTQLVLVTMVSVVVSYSSLYIGKLIKTSDIIRKYIYLEK